MKTSSGSVVGRGFRQRKQPMQERSQVTVEAVLEATLQILHRESAAKVTTTRIAERAGVSVGTLYQYFPDKQAVLTALYLRFLERAQAAAKAGRESVRDLPQREAVPVLINALITFKRDNLQSILALREPMAILDGPLLVKQLVETMFGLMHEVVRDPLQARVLVAAIDGALSWAIENDPSLLNQESFRAALNALALGYVAST